MKYILWKRKQHHKERREAAPPKGGGGQTIPRCRGRVKREESTTTHKTDWEWKAAPSTIVSGSREGLPRKRSCEFGQLGSIWPVFLLRENTTKNEEWKAAPLQRRERDQATAPPKRARGIATLLRFTPLLLSPLEVLCLLFFSFLTTVAFCCPLHPFFALSTFSSPFFPSRVFYPFWTPCLPLFTFVYPLNPFYRFLHFWLPSKKSHLFTFDISPHLERQ